ncbi:ferredoxin [Streptomyces sp. NBC_01089]|uniref:ferredoxin n=1 Tax=Streptomyces sp. NBC_01089 TaxID=2903747 RepID=UPI00386E308F|nr:ferredoxin [Streptomyces sp. NBC_01089]
MTRQDNRLLDAPMRPVVCERCAATVLVRKGSWHQTSIQWDGAAMDACEERRSTVTVDGERSGTRLETCGRLRDTVRRAALDGVIDVPDPGAGDQEDTL